VSKEVLLGAAGLRARYRLRTPDSILLATGIRSGATAAITNDNGWKAAQGLGIEIILLSQLVSWAPMRSIRRAINRSFRAWVNQKRRKQAAQEMDALRAVAPKVRSAEVARWTREDREQGHWRQPDRHSECVSSEPI